MGAKTLSMIMCMICMVMWIVTGFQIFMTGQTMAAAGCLVMAVLFCVLIFVVRWYYSNKR